METTERSKSEKSGWKWFFRIAASVLVFLLAFLIYYMVMSAYSTNRWVKDINTRYTEQDKKDIDPLLINDQKYVALQNDIAFIKARLAMSKTDSIGLIINLPDSMMALNISGVDVSIAKIHRCKLSRSLYAIDHEALATILSNPLQITHSVATIEKEPIIDKIAPRDTTEANLPVKIPEVTKGEPVFFELTLENGFKILVLQNETSTGEERFGRFAFNLKRASDRAWENMISLLTFKVPEYSPEILMMVSAADARAIYRAVPERGKVCISLLNP